VSAIGDDLLRESPADFDPRTESVVVYDRNPVSVAPESRMVVAGLARGNVLAVVLVHVLTDTAEQAQCVLPATIRLEHMEVPSTHGPTCRMQNRRAIAPVSQGKPNTQLVRGLAARVGLTGQCFERIVRRAFKGITLKDLRARLDQAADPRGAVR